MGASPRDRQDRQARDPPFRRPAGNAADGHWRLIIEVGRESSRGSGPGQW